MLEEGEKNGDDDAAFEAFAEADEEHLGDGQCRRLMSYVAMDEAL